ncbi:hypothetical protein QT683_22535, partial [Xanthomonas citri pv. citri]
MNTNSSNSDSVPRPEYPRPDKLRPHHAHRVLNGIWAFAFDEQDRGQQERWNRGGAQGSIHPALDKEIIVPFAHQTQASGLNDKRACEVVWYARRFHPEHLLTQQGGLEQDNRVLLHFAAVDYEAKVWVQGELVAEHRGGHVPFYADITDVLERCKVEGVEEIAVVVRA